MSDEIVQEGAEAADEAVEAQPEVEQEAVDGEGEVEEGGEASQSEAQDAVDDAKTNEEIKALGAEYDDHVVAVKIDGEEKQLTVGELKRLTSLEKASQKRFEEASEREKKALQLVQIAKENPEELFQKLGMNAEEFAENLLRRRVEESEMSPEQRELMQIKKERAKEQEEYNRIQAQRYREEMDKGFTEAFSKAELPKQPFLVQRAAAEMRASIQRAKAGQGEPLSFEGAVDKVRSWLSDGIRGYLNELTPEGIAQFLGDDTVAKLRQHEVSRIRTGTAPSAKSNERAALKDAVPAKRSQKRKPMSEKEWRSYVDSL